jgi:hypothetical protein
MKQKLIPAVAALAVLTACSTQQVGEFARALQTNAPATSTAQVVQPTQQPKQAPVSLESAGTVNSCKTEVSPNRDALLVTAGHNTHNQFFSCAVGSPLVLSAHRATFNAVLIQLLCDPAKPISATGIDEDRNVVNCTYVGPRNLPTNIDGVPLKAI